MGPEDGDWAWMVSEEWIEVMFQAKGVPSVPLFVMCSGLLSGDSCSGRFLLCNADVNPKCMGGCSWQRVQDVVWGKRELNNVSDWLSVRSQHCQP